MTEFLLVMRGYPPIILFIGLIDFYRCVDVYALFEIVYQFKNRTELVNL